MSAVAVLSLAWTVYVITRPPATSLTVGCYAAADLQSWTEVVRNDGRAPAEICEELWSRGVFGPGPTPTLQSCALSTGVVGVFPVTAGDTCARLGAVPLPASPPSVAPEQDPIALRDALTEAFHGESCIDEPRAVQIVKEELADRGLFGWTVSVAGTFTGQRPCASLGFDLALKQVLLIPVPRT
ncbi:MAG: hypothetical protein ACRD12_21705 [Acidimicrobiales bacterium]